MKKILFLFVGWLTWGPLFAQSPQLDPLQDPEVMAVGTDETRYPLLPYNNMELALKGDIASSTYLQWLNGTWKVKLFPTPTQIDTTLTAIDADLSGWGTTPVPTRRNDDAWGAIYRTEFKMPFAWIDREVFVHVGPVNRAYYVFVNGRQAGYFENSQSAAEFNLTKLVKEGKNHLSIIAYADPASTLLENQSQARGTGITGDVYIFSQPKVRMRDYVIDTRFAPDGTSGLFNLGVIVKSHLLNPKQVTVYYDLYAPDSTKVSSGKRDARFDMRREDTVRFFANIPNIDSWSHESPKLYTVALRLQHEGRFTEYTAFKIGFREVAYDDKGITINGRPLQIRAIDYTCPPDESTLRQELAQLRRLGVNLLRVNNYPQHKIFYDLCDQYGFYVCDQANLDSRLSGEELKIGGTPANDTLWARAYIDRVCDMYYASKNHPSVIMFSLGGQAGQGYNTYEAYLKLKSLESDRPIIYQAAGAQWNTDMVVGNPADRNASDPRYALHFGTPEEWRATPVLPAEARFSESTRPDGAILRNGYQITNLSNFRIGYTVLSGKKIVKEGTIPVAVAPQSSQEIRASLEGLKPGKYTLNLYVCHKDDVPWAHKGERLAEITRQLVIPKAPKH